MKIIIAKTAGFCWGVRRAIDKVFELREQTNGPIETFGPLIHNPQILNKLEESGIRTIEKIDDISSNEVVIRTHGVPPDERKSLKEKHLHLLDTTCPDVARIHAIIKRASRAGCNIIIAGHQGHAEVRGLMGYAGEKGFLVEKVDDVKKLPELEKVALVSQSTFSKSEFSAIIDAVTLKYEDAEIHNTICDATHDRQEEVKDLARKVDVVFVIGGRGSSNTNRLAEVSKSLGTKTFHIETESELEEEMLEGAESVGVTAGASTPDWIINQVVDKLQHFADLRAASKPV